MSLRVLLISALPGLDPACGDVTYTESLLAHPPAGVLYETYAQAVSRGALREHGDGRSLKRAFKERRSLSAEMLRTAANKSLNVLRKRKLMFWEPFRFFSVRPGEYDLIHLHVFSARFIKPPCPIVVSVGAPQRLLYADARNQSRTRVALGEAAEVGMSRLLGVNSGSYYLPQASRLVTYTRFAKEWFVGRGVLPEDRVDIVPIFMDKQGGESRTASTPRTIGFVAKDFAAKGGPTLLNAFERVRATRPDARLVIVGCEPQLNIDAQRAAGIEWHAYVPRERLLSEFLPSFDVFAYPTTCDCISYVFLEAMSEGLALATSDYPSMPEAVDFGRAGMISAVGDEEGLAINILKLLEPETNQHYRSAARQRFRDAYSAAAVLPKLRETYNRALSN